MRADEPGAAGDQYLHGRSPCRDGLSGCEAATTPFGGTVSRANRVGETHAQVSIVGVIKVLTNACSMQARYTKSSTIRNGLSTTSRGLRNAIAATAIHAALEPK